ncbi:ATP-binding protein [Phycisphaerales bacterium AB-hyl4]|uniref:ATP-binding protein n=1 Tax=Natronomicrosphaera hydrolytica TaxID=3242702 RepID=A0ABV4U853_9BACT
MDGIAGQPRALDVLQAQLASGRVHHAYIFHGPAGVGKFTTAVALGRVLLCHEQARNLMGQVEACGGCESCRLLGQASREAAETDSDEPAAMASAHPDLHVITKELAKYSEESTIRNRKLTQIPVEVVRAALIEPVYRGARLGHGKVFIVDEAELLNQSGQNALLKTLEEPPAGTTIILVTASEDRLLPTIRSRCQRVPFVPLPGEVVANWVEGHAGELDAWHRDWLTSFADGSLGRAAMAMDYELTEWADVVLPALDDIANGRLHGELGAQLAERIDGFAKTWVDRHANASKEAANKLAAQLMATLICTHARRRMYDLAQRCEAGNSAGAEAALEPWLGVVDAVHEAMSMLGSNVNLSLVCDYLVTTLSRRLAGVAAG